MIQSINCVISTSMALPHNTVLTDELSGPKKLMGSVVQALAQK